MFFPNAIWSPLQNFLPNGHLHGSPPLLATSPPILFPNFSFRCSLGLYPQSTTHSEILLSRFLWELPQTQTIHRLHISLPSGFSVVLEWLDGEEGPTRCPHNPWKDQLCPVDPITPFFLLGPDPEEGSTFLQSREPPAGWWLGGGFFKNAPQMEEKQLSL